MSWRNGDDLGVDAQRSDNRGVAANERLTAMAGAALLCSDLVELATLSSLGTLLSGYDRNTPETRRRPRSAIDGE